MKIKINGKYITMTRYVYQKAHPEYVWKPRDCFVHLDRDKSNYAPENIEVCSMKVIPIFSHIAKRAGVTTTEQGRLVFLQAKLQLACFEAGERRGEISKCDGKICKSGVFKEQAREKAREKARRLREDPVFLEKLRKRNTKYRKTHCEEIRNRNRERYKDPEYREKLLERKRKWYNAHREEQNRRYRETYAARREEMHERYMANREKILDRKHERAREKAMQRQSNQEGV